MKSPDDATARKARLRRELVDAFVAGDMDTWRNCTRELKRMLEAQGLARRKAEYQRRARYGRRRPKR